MRLFSYLLLAAATLTLLLLVSGATAHLPGARAWLLALGFQLPALWTGLALGGIFRAVRGRGAVPVALYLALGVTLVNYFYFAVEFSAVRAGH